MAVSDGLEVDVDTRELMNVLARRLDVAAGRVRLQLIFSDGEYVDGYIEERLMPRDLECRCRRHAWNPDCPRHKEASIGT